MPTDPTGAPHEHQSSWFSTTHWSIVLAAAQEPGPEGRVALEELCRAYWYPLYAYVRWRGYAAEDAEDLTQEFFARLLEKEYLGLANPARGRFRTFLLSALRNFLTNSWKRSTRQKRGGTHALLSLDASDAEQRYALEPADPSTPERNFEKRWAATVLERVLARAREEYASKNKTALFEGLKTTLWGEQDRPSYATLGARLGMSEGAIKVAVVRLRQRHRELLRAEIAQTVARPEDVDDELKHFLSILSG